MKTLVKMSVTVFGHLFSVSSSTYVHLYLNTHVTSYSLRFSHLMLRLKLFGKTGSRKNWDAKTLHWGALCLLNQLIIQLNIQCVFIQLENIYHIFYIVAWMYYRGFNEVSKKLSHLKLKSRWFMAKQPSLPWKAGSFVSNSLTWPWLY